jgi:hypothetical protein
MMMAIMMMMVISMGQIDEDKIGYMDDKSLSRSTSFLVNSIMLVSNITA